MTRKILLGATALLMLTGCQTSVFGEQVATDPYRMQLNQDAAQWRFTAIDMGGSAELITRSDNLAKDFRHRGTGQLHATVAALSTKQASDWAGRLYDTLLTSGVPAEKLEVTPLTVPSRSNYHPLGAVVTYRTVSVDDFPCGATPDGSAPLGCSLERNLANMVAHPSDLAGRTVETDSRSVETSGGIARRAERDFTTAPSLLDEISTTED